MTQPVLAVAPAPAAAIPVAAVPGAVPGASPPAPAVGPNASEGGEPTIEELSALLPDPTAPATPAAAPVVEEPVVEETPADAAPADPAAETPAPADDALERATKAAAKAREGSRRYQETQEQLRRTAALQQQQAAEAEHLRREVAAARQREEDLKKDPYKTLKNLGMTDEALARRAMEENSPEAATLRLAEELKAERAARVALETRLENERTAAQQRMVQQQAESAFLDAAKDTDAFPELAIRRPAAQLVAAREALAQMRANGYDTRHLSNAQVAEAAELWLAPTTPRKAAAAAKPAPAPAPAAKVAGKTLTNSMAQTRTTAPADFDSLSDEDQIAAIAAALPDPVG